MEKQTLITLLLFLDWRTGKRAGVSRSSVDQNQVYTT